MEIYSVRDLSFSYPGADTPAINNISFTAYASEFITICGLSGSGKSTLLRQLKSCLTPQGESTGSVYFFGRPLEETDKYVQAQKIGFVMQSPDDQTITDTVMHELVFGLEGMGLSRAEMTQRAAEIVSCFGMEDMLDKKIHELSGGQKQLLNLAGVMVMKPEVIILDEPTAQLDPVAANEFLSLLSRIHSVYGTTIIIASHDLSVLFSLSTRIIVMENGRIISDAAPNLSGQKLCKESRVYKSLPLPARVFLEAEKQPGNNIPLDNAQGRRWLRSFTEEKDISVPVPDNEYERTHEPCVKLRGIRFRYEKNGRDILKGTELEAYSGEIIAVAGGNGTGKTTFLGILSGALKPYEGKITFKDIDSKHPRIAFLPQEPKSVFVRDSVYSELYDIASEECGSQDEAKLLVSAAARLCGIEDRLKSHPYDLSGGEQQKAALAKIILTGPQILLLDEPVKGLDPSSKEEIGRLLVELKKHGVCIIMISHEMDFCAEYADRCTILFDGCLSELCSTHEFFLRNTYYTSSAALLSEGIIDNIITENELFSALGHEIKNADKSDDGGKSRLVDTLYKPRKVPEKKHKIQLGAVSRISLTKTALFIIFLISSFYAVFSASGLIYGSQILSAALALISGVICLTAEIVFPGEDSIAIARPQRSKRLIITAALTVFAFVPFTIFAGIYFLNDERILFISLLILIECMIPFFVQFEGRSIRTRELVIISVMSSFCVIGRAAFYMLPEFKPVTALVIISGAALGSESGFLIGALSMLVSNMLFGQGPWTPWQMFAMGLIGFLSGMLYSGKLIRKNKRSFAVFGFAVSVLIYGGIMDPAAIIMSRLPFTPESVAAYYLSGLPMDLVHGISSALFLYFGAIPILRKLERVKKKYGLIQ